MMMKKDNKDSRAPWKSRGAQVMTTTTQQETAIMAATSRIIKQPRNLRPEHNLKMLRSIGEDEEEGLRLRFRVVGGKRRLKMVAASSDLVQCQWQWQWCSNSSFFGWGRKSRLFDSFFFFFLIHFLLRNKATKFKLNQRALWAYFQATLLFLLQLFMNGTARLTWSVRLVRKAGLDSDL